MNLGLEKIVQDNAMFSNSFWRTNFLHSDKVEIHLPGERFCNVHDCGKRNTLRMMTGTANRI